MNNIILGIFGVIFLIYSSAVINVQSQNVTIDLCNSKMSCRDCIQIQNCAWCLESNYSHPRCYNEQKTECKNFWYPVNSGEITEQLPTTQKKSSDPLEKIVQISPQRVSIKLRISE